MTPDEIAGLLDPYRAGIEAELTLLRQVADVPKDQRQATQNSDFAALGQIADAALGSCAAWSRLRRVSVQFVRPSSIIASSPPRFPATKRSHGATAKRPPRQTHPRNRSAVDGRPGQRRARPAQRRRRPRTRRDDAGGVPRVLSPPRGEREACGQDWLAIASLRLRDLRARASTFKASLLHVFMLILNPVFPLPFEPRHWPGERIGWMREAAFAVAAQADLLKRSL